MIPDWLVPASFDEWAILALLVLVAVNLILSATSPTYEERAYRQRWVLIALGIVLLVTIAYMWGTLIDLRQNSEWIVEMLYGATCS